MENNDSKNTKVSKESPDYQDTYYIDSNSHHSDYTRIRHVHEKLDELYSVRIQLNPLTLMMVVGFVETQKRVLGTHDITFINEVYPSYFPKESIYENEVAMKELRLELRTCMNSLPFGFLVTKFNTRKAQRAEVIYKELSRLELQNIKLAQIRPVIR